MESFIFLFLYFSNIMACQDLNKKRILTNTSKIKYLNTFFSIIIQFLLINMDNNNFEEEQQKESEKILDFLKKNID